MPAAKNGHTILLGEDDPEVRRYLEMALKCQGYAVALAKDGEEVLEHLRTSEEPVSAILLDIIMPRKDGFEALKEIRRWNSEVPVIMISAAFAPFNVVEAVRYGANDFLPKPVNPEDLRNALKSVLEGKAPSVPGQSRQTGAPATGDEIFFGAAPPMRQLQNLIGQIAWSEAPVLILGETGVGKEVIARELHAQSPRAKRPFLKLNCAALPSELVESELFGYERGAFTGAFQKKLGMFDMADGGTILLDEIGDMDFKLQAKLLQVLQDHEFQRLGGKETVRVDVRVIAATHRDLARAIEENSFREDLYYRLNLISVYVPPLRERKEDILPLAEFLVKKHSAPGASPARIPPRLQEVFLTHQWPGNIRELENVVRKFLIFRDTELIEGDLRSRVKFRTVTPPAPAMPAADNERSWPAADMDPARVERPDPAVPILEQVSEARKQAERTAILNALNAKNWNRKQAARMLTIDYKALLYKMKKLSIRKERAAASSRRMAGASVSVAAVSAAN
ncbi:MAG: sigma-54 dependent transcriptional regulator [Acidobacteriia bacterium]|nr:sigma-54 dependent transcriptional regulator [Terriglobia bacterium]